MDALIGIAGVILGFALGAFYQEFRDWRRRKRLIVQLRDELKANLYVLPQKRATIQSILEHLEARSILPGDSVPFCTAIFDSHYSEVAPFLTQKQRNLLQVVYSNLSTVDHTLSSFEPAVRAATPGEGEQREMISFTNRFRDLLDALEQQESLILSFQDDVPIDVFYLDMDYDQLKQAKITKG